MTLTIWPPSLPMAPHPGAAPGGASKTKHAHEEEAPSKWLRPDQDEGLENVDFAAITGKAAPGSAPAPRGDAAVAAEPAKKKKRKREANLVVRGIGMVISALLAVVCFYAIAVWIDHKNDYFHLLRFLKDNKPTANNAQTPAANANVPANAAPTTPNAGKVDQTPGADNSQPKTGNASADNQTAANPPAGKQPAEVQGGPAAGETKPAPTPNKAENSDAGKSAEVAMNPPAKEDTKPAAPSTSKAPDSPDPFAGGTDTKPSVATPAKPETSPAPDAEAFGPAPAVAPVNEKSKTDAKPGVKTDVPAAKPETPAKPDADPFGPRRPLLP